MWKRHVQAPLAVLALVSGGLALNLASAPTATALPQSTKVALIPSDYGQADNGGTLLKTGWKSAGFAPTFTDVSLASIQDAGGADPLPAYDTAVLFQVCDIGTYLSNATFNGRLTSFVANGGKLIVWDSECEGVDYSKFIFPFTTSTPGAQGDYGGTLTITEDSFLGSNSTASPYYLNTSAITTDTDAVGDANVFTSYDGNWCLSKWATNTLGANGPVNTYAEYGKGLVIYLGLDSDWVGYDDPPSDNSPTASGAQNLGYLWELMLRQPWNPVQGLPCSQSASGITLSPATATNTIGTGHTVTATLVDNNQKAVTGVPVTFTVVSGPHQGTTAKVTTGATGKAAFTYTGTKVGVDKIQASATFATATGSAAVPRTSNVVTKTWVGTAVSGPRRGIRPDALIRTIDSAYVGNDIYNRTARRQTVKSLASHGDVVSFWVRIYNDGKVKGTITAKAINSTQGPKIRYFSGGKNVTAAMTSANGLSFKRAPGHFKQFRVQVTVGQHAVVDGKVFAKVMASSTRRGVVREDAVKAVVSVKGTATPTTLPGTGGRN